MKKILFLIPTLGHGGAEKVLVNLVNNMDRTQWDITVQTLFDEGVNKQYLKPDVHYKSFMKHQFHGNSVLLAHIPAKWLYRRIVRDRYDILVSYLEGPTVHIVAGCPFADTKKVAWIHIELGDDRKYSVGFASKKAATAGYLGMDNIVCVSETVKEVFEKTAGIAFPHIEVLYNTNETAQILEKAKERIDDVTFRSDEVNIISVAKLMHSKGYDRLAAVHRRLMDEGLRHHIYILGVGEDREKLERYLAEHQLQDSFTFLGYRDNPYKYVAAADLYVCSSRREGFSTAVTEALIVGTPVVSTCCSGAYELLGKNNEYGIVTANSEEGIYEGMKAMLSDPALLADYAAKAAERGKEFSTEKTIRAVEEMLMSL